MMKKPSNGVVPVNTEYSTHWAEKNFLPWAENRNKKMPDNPVPMDLLCRASLQVPVLLCNGDMKREWRT